MLMFWRTDGLDPKCVGGKCCDI